MDTGYALWCSAMEIIRSDLNADPACMARESEHRTLVDCPDPHYVGPHAAPYD
jgi:hypothetical protein